MAREERREKGWKRRRRDVYGRRTNQPYSYTSHNASNQAKRGNNEDGGFDTDRHTTQLSSTVFRHKNLLFTLLWFFPGRARKHYAGGEGNNADEEEEEEEEEGEEDWWRVINNFKLANVACKQA